MCITCEVFGLFVLIRHRTVDRLGLAGELARTKTRLYDLVKIKDTGTGWLKATAATLAVTGALLLLGAKAFLVDLLSKAAG